jgi:hypothetical protein
VCCWNGAFKTYFGTPQATTYEEGMQWALRIFLDDLRACFSSPKLPLVTRRAHRGPNKAGSLQLVLKK